MSQQLYEIICVKHQQKAQVIDPLSWICPICKEAREHPFKRVNHCGVCANVWLGDPGCPKCKLEDVKEKALRRLPILESEKKRYEGSAQIMMALENKRLAKIKLEKESKEALTKLPDLLTELLTEIKGLREDIKK